MVYQIIFVLWPAILNNRTNGVSEKLESWRREGGK